MVTCLQVTYHGTPVMCSPDRAPRWRLAYDLSAPDTVLDFGFMEGITHTPGILLESLSLAEIVAVALAVPLDLADEAADVLEEAIRNGEPPAAYDLLVSTYALEDLRDYLLMYHG